jgi:hypothetical protein
MEGSLLKALFYLLSSLLSLTALADDVNNEWLSTTRSLSMGNVGIASAEDPATAMFYNPAALGRTKKTIVEIFNPQTEFGSGFIGLSQTKSDYTKHLSLNKVRPLLEAKPRKASYLGASLYPNLSAQNFNFGILLRGEGSAYSAGVDGTLTYRSRYLLIPTMAVSIGALGGRLKLGFAARAIQITENDTSTTTFTNIGYKVNPAEGFGVGFDAGALFSLPWSALPTFGFTARNIGDTRFAGSALTSIGTGTIRAHEKVKMTYDAGFGLFPKIGKRSVFTMAADYRDIQNVHGVDIKRRINLGMEIALDRTFYLRAGASRGYWTAGFGIGSKYGSLDIGTYSEELDRTGFRVLEDRRFSIRYGGRF